MEYISKKLQFAAYGRFVLFLNKNQSVESLQSICLHRAITKQPQQIMAHDASCYQFEVPLVEPTKQLKYLNT